VTTTAFLAGRQATWASGRAFRTLPTAAGLAVAQEMTQMSDQQILGLIDRSGRANWDLAQQYQVGQGWRADTAVSIAWCRGMIAELDFTPARSSQL
jgi:hypothetical protein